MSENWNEGLRRVLGQHSDYIAVLADRRLLTANILNAVHHLESINRPFLCFDHQDVWINASTITNRKATNEIFLIDRGQLLSAIGSARINWHFPMLFNCLIRSEFMQDLLERYGSCAEGSSPDMNFLARIADIGIDCYCVLDAPCIVTNARHAASSNGSSALRTGTIHDIEHTRLSGIEAYPDYMANFVTANITGSLARYWNDHQMRQILDPTNFFVSSLLEFSYPKSEEAFCAMKISLKQFANSFSLDNSLVAAIDEVKHTPAANQVYPIDSTVDLVNSPNLNLLCQIENRQFAMINGH